MSVSGEVRFEYSLNSLHDAFTAKTRAIQVCLEMGIFYKECVEEFQVFPIKIVFRNMFASDKVRF